ncbi:Phosphatidylinositolglycan class N-domain-containing protein [Suillus bovinus]|uniref:Phosphatidylinositolglycan class N-domain-containing protein n=1 Tax=Suillus bovinus TaxID=48563 RepID=UPI001B85E466|nr:Phosphatidylinositolglycan class N-domain-containing protein [Suillus bovinus]KAG2135363.1 Phosphatidylinositolglycan class N-domain-containing protein [Suillus bovinus]
MSVSSHRNVLELLTLGLIFHVVFIASVFDCYFTSPVVHGMPPRKAGPGEAKRVVLIVGDGLRADLLFNVNAFSFIPSSPKIVAPYLRDIVQTRGAFGLSHTRVPTESRPGHVAIIGGMYEDVSAVTKGWKTNPVHFDSIFNQSSHTFSFGSPDILPMFAQGATPGKVDTWSYDEEDEDFTKGTKTNRIDATALDTWVLDQLQTLFQNASSNDLLDSELRADKVVFFLHLLGLDTTGHSYRPHSKEYMNNIQVVDHIVRRTEELFSDFYHDEETSFIFTADHGMSKIGNHGDGDPDNTRTPLIAWGRGIRGPLPDIIPSSHDEYSRPWQLDDFMRRDVEQADLAPLMAALLGINYPVNSVGILPDADPTRPGYLLPREGESALARLALANAESILEHYQVKHESKAAQTILYKPFGPLEEVSQDGKLLRVSWLSKIERLISNGRWFEARRETAELIKVTLQGLRYLETYNRVLIRIIVMIAYLGWSAYASLSIFPPPASLVSDRQRTVVRIATATILAIFWALFAAERAPWTFYVYVTFPCYFWQQFALRGVPIAVQQFKSSDRRGHFIGRVLFHLVIVVVVLQCMVAAYTHRSLWSIGFLTMGFLWPYASWPSHVRSQHLRLLLSWMSSCLITGVFPLLSVNKREDLYMIMCGGAMILAVGAGCARLASNGASKDAKLSVIIQALFILLAMTITASSVKSLQAKQGLSTINQTSAWLILAVSSIYPFISKAQHNTPTSRIASLFLGFGVCFVILSISVEGLFYAAFTCNLLLWIEVEAIVQSKRASAASQNQGCYEFQTDDIRIALFFLFFVQVAFFGTGNVASISSFYLEPVYRLVPIFNPFLMAALLIFKIVAPYVILSAVFATLNARLHLPPFSLFLVALTLTDGMTMAFFLNVTDTGSWLEIGQSISFFCITSLLLVWSAGICTAGEYLMVDTLVFHRSTDSRKLE